MCRRGRFQFSPWFWRIFNISLGCFPARLSPKPVTRHRRSITAAYTIEEGASMIPNTIQVIAALVDPGTVRIGAGVLFVVIVCIIVMRRKKMAAKNKPGTPRRALLLHAGA